MQFAEISANDNRQSSILNLAHRLYLARLEEQAADKLAREASARRMKIEADLCDFVGYVVEGSGVEPTRINGVHTQDEAAIAEEGGEE